MPPTRTYKGQPLDLTMALQGPKLRPAGRQCDWKFSVGDQNFKASRQQATNF